MKKSVLNQHWVLDVQDLRAQHSEVKQAIRELMRDRPNGSVRRVALCDLEEWGDVETYGPSREWTGVIAAFLKEQLPDLGETEQVLIHYWW